MTQRKILTLEQRQLTEEFINTYDFSPEQISFEGTSPEPIFDYEALNVLRLRITDIQTADVEIVERNMQLGIVSAKCTVYLPDGRSANDIGSAMFPTFNEEGNLKTEGEIMPDGSRLGNLIQAQNVALSRALRRAIRAAGINLLKAHKQFIQNGQVTNAEVDEEFQSPIGKEIHKLAGEWGHIKGKDKTAYQDFIESVFGTGNRSTLDLNDIQRSQLANIYRNMVTSRNVTKSETLPEAA